MRNKLEIEDILVQEKKNMETRKSKNQNANNLK